MRHLSPPQKQGPRYLDATRNPKAAKAQLQGPRAGWGTRLSISALARAPPGHWQVHAAWLVFSALQTRQGEGAHRSHPTLLPQLPYGLPLGTGLLDTSFCPKNSSARPRHRCIFLNSSCRQRGCVFSQARKASRTSRVLCRQEGALGPGGKQENAAGEQPSSRRGRRCGGSVVASPS